MAESEEEIKNILMMVRKESETGLKVNTKKSRYHSIQFHHFVANRR